LTATHGPTAADEASQHQLDQLVALAEVVRKEKIDCDLVETSSFDVYFDENRAREARDFIRVQQARGIPWAREIQWVQGSDLDRVSFFLKKYEFKHILRKSIGYWNKEQQRSPESSCSLVMAI
jgi:hypothetical protein